MNKILDFPYQMDPELAGWILEFLLRKPVPDRIIKRILASLPIPHYGSRLKKTLLLRTIQDDISQASVSESILEYLEIIEEIDYRDGIATTELMKSAYCAVAVECTLKYISTITNKNSEYFNAVKRIWRGRIWGMETSVEGSKLFTDELIRWRDDIEAAHVDLELCTRLRNLNTRGDALSKLGDYLAETWEKMGPPFLESVATFQNLVHDFEIRDDDMIETNEDQDIGPHLFNWDKGRSHSSTDTFGNCDAVCIEEPPVTVDVAKTPVIDGSQANEQLEGKTDTFADGIQELGRSHLPAQGDRACMEEMPATELNQANEQLQKKVDGGQDLRGSVLPAQGERVCLEEVPVEDGSHSNEILQNETETLVEGETEMQKGSQLLKTKHAAASYRRLKRVRINDDEEECPETLHHSYDPLPSSEVNKVRESLKSSSLELKALVKDPLPEALQKSEIVRFELAMKGMHHERPIENQSKNLGLPDPGACKNVTSIQSNDANIRGKSSVCENNDCRPSLMERNSTAQTYVWSDSMENLSGEVLEKASKFHLPSPKRTDISPLERHETCKFIINRRRVRKWSLLEEDTLRAGVRRFGKGRWKEILISYPDVFEERTEVDLKDKWRNMTRYGDQGGPN